LKKQHFVCNDDDAKTPSKEMLHHNDNVLASSSTPAAAILASVGGNQWLRTFVPPEFADHVSQKRRRHKTKGKMCCRFNTCDKFGRSRMDGFCKTHFNMFSLDNVKSLDVETSLSSHLSFSSSVPVSFAKVPEITLLERTREELLNGRDCWICIDCSVEVPSITYPCWKCNKLISFVPLDLEEFEHFVQNEREKNMKKRQDEEQRRMNGTAFSR
jgi:hypothetical protein